MLLQIYEILSRFERKGYKLVAIKLIVPSKEFAEKHYQDMKERPFFNGLCDFISFGPVLAMVSIPHLCRSCACIESE
jgi:nucleoside-diphosphate kinase